MLGTWGKYITFFTPIHINHCFVFNLPLSEDEHNDDTFDIIKWQIW